MGRSIILWQLYELHCMHLTVTCHPQKASGQLNHISQKYVKYSKQLMCSKEKSLYHPYCYVSTQSTLTVSNQNRSSSVFRCRLSRFISHLPPFLLRSSSHMGCIPSCSKQCEHWEKVISIWHHQLHTLNKLT